jgi:transposase
MAGRRLMTVDVRELLRRLQLGQAHRAISRDLGIARKTVARYHEICRERGWLEGALPETHELNRVLNSLSDGTSLPPPIYKAEPYREAVIKLREKGVEMRAIFQRLQSDGYTGSYSSLYRFVRHLEPPSIPTGFCRVETDPGEEAQVDFGYAGRMKDRATGEERKVWFFLMTLSYSRHQFVRFVFDQSVETWLRCHRLAFEAFGGVPKRIKLDNLKAAIIKAALHDPEAQRSYRDFAEHYGFLISPCRPRTPEHKGKVESGVHYVKRNFLAGQDFRDLQDANERVEIWVEEIAGIRIHGTTHDRPLSRFLEHERSALLRLPSVPFDMAVWTKAKLHPDCHLVINGAYYSAPHRLIGESLWVRHNQRDVVIFHEHERIATHSWGPKGTRRTLQSHYPPDKVAGLMATPQWCREKSKRVGPAVFELTDRMLEERPLDRLRSVQSILRLEERYGAVRLEAACRRALDFGDLRYGTIKRILERRLENQDRELSPPRDGSAEGSSSVQKRARVYSFARPGSEIFGLKEAGGTDHGREAPVDPQAQGPAPLGHSGDFGCA